MLCYNIMLNDAIWPLCIETLNYCVAICFKYFKMFPNVRVSNKMSSQPNSIYAYRPTRRIQAKRGPAAVSITSIYERITHKKKTSSVSKNIKGHHAHIVAYKGCDIKLSGASWCDIDEMEQQQQQQQRKIYAVQRQIMEMLFKYFAEFFFSSSFCRISAR